MRKAKLRPSPTWPNPLASTLAEKTPNHISSIANSESRTWRSAATLISRPYLADGFRFAPRARGLPGDVPLVSDSKPDHLFELAAPLTIRELPCAATPQTR